jgi:hypothetical protein
MKHACLCHDNAVPHFLGITLAHARSLGPWFIQPVGRSHVQGGNPKTHNLVVKSRPLGLNTDMRTNSHCVAWHHHSRILLPLYRVLDNQCARHAGALDQVGGWVKISPRGPSLGDRL